MFLEYDLWPRVGMIIGLLLMTAIPDYLSLAKTRMIIRMSRSGSFPVLTKLLLMDVFVGIMISILSVIICIEAGVVLLAIVGAQVEEVTTNAGITFGTDDSLSFLRSIYESNSSGAVRMVVEAIVKSIGHFLTGADSSIYTVQLTSTLLTSVWIFLILLSTTVLKLITPLHQFTSWFFDVEAHPLQAIGVIAGALVVVAALILSLIRAVI